MSAYEGHWKKLALGALIICTPNIGSVLTYYYCSDAYMLSYLLAVVSCYYMIAADWNLKGIVYVGLSAGCLIFSLGIYQAYISVAAIICVLFLLFMLLESKNLLSIVKRAEIMLISGTIGILGYFIIMKVTQMITHTAPQSRLFSQNGNRFVYIFQNIGNVYKYFGEYFLGKEFINNEWGYRKEVNIVFFCVLLYILIFRIIKIQNGRVGKLLAVLLIGLLPLISMSIIFVASQVDVKGETGALMLPGMNYIYVMLLIFMPDNRIKSKIAALQKIAVLAVVVLVLNFLLVLNLSIQSYIQYNMRKACYVAGEIVNEIEKLI